MTWPLTACRKQPDRARRTYPRRTRPAGRTRGVLRRCRHRTRPLPAARRRRGPDHRCRWHHPDRTCCPGMGRPGWPRQSAAGIVPRRRRRGAGRSPGRCCTDRRERPCRAGTSRTCKRSDTDTDAPHRTTLRRGAQERSYPTRTPARDRTPWSRRTPCRARSPERTCRTSHPARSSCSRGSGTGRSPRTALLPAAFHGICMAPRGRRGAHRSWPTRIAARTPLWPHRCSRFPKASGATRRAPPGRCDTPADRGRRPRRPLNNATSTRTAAPRRPRSQCPRSSRRRSATTSSPRRARSRSRAPPPTASPPRAIIQRLPDSVGFAGAARNRRGPGSSRRDMA